MKKSIAALAFAKAEGGVDPDPAWPLASGGFRRRKAHTQYSEGWPSGCEDTRALHRRNRGQGVRHGRRVRST